MKSRGVSLLLCAAAALFAAPVAHAQSSQGPQVGVPGCADDVPVAARRETISFDSRGRAIRGHLYSPTGPANGRALVLLHGGTGFEMNAILFDAHAIQLASRGWFVLLPAYFDAAAPDPSRRTVTARAWRQVALDAAEALAAEAGVPGDRVALWGYSRGAGVALSATTTPDAISRPAILVAGAGEVEHPIVGRGLSFLILHARRDEAVPVRATIDMARDLEAAGAHVDLQELNFDGHQYDLPTWCDAMARTRAFLETTHGSTRP